MSDPAVLDLAIIAALLVSLALLSLLAERP
jgi:hypothetical protein